MADRNFKSCPPAWRPPPQHLQAAAAYIIGSICQMMAMVSTALWMRSLPKPVLLFHHAQHAMMQTQQMKTNKNSPLLPTVCPTRSNVAWLGHRLVNAGAN